jgi:hypothetical protein
MGKFTIVADSKWESVEEVTNRINAVAGFNVLQCENGDATFTGRLADEAIFMAEDGLLEHLMENAGMDESEFDELARKEAYSIANKIGNYDSLWDEIHEDIRIEMRSVIKAEKEACEA